MLRARILGLANVLVLPVDLSASRDTDRGEAVIRPTEAWQTARLTLKNPDEFRVEENYYVEVRKGS